MKKHKLNRLFFFLLIIVCIFVLFVVTIKLLPTNNSEDTSIQYINIENNDYYLVNNASIKKELFTDEDYYRITGTIDYCNAFTEIVKSSDITSTSPIFSDIEKIYLNDSQFIFGKVVNGDYKNDFYVDKSFKLPEISANEISKIEISIFGEKESMEFQLNTDDDINEFIDNIQDYVTKYNPNREKNIVCYVYYKNYTFIERLYSDDLKYLLVQVTK